MFFRQWEETGASGEKGHVENMQSSTQRDPHPATAVNPGSLLLWGDSATNQAAVLQTETKPGMLSLVHIPVEYQILVETRMWKAQRDGNKKNNKQLNERHIRNRQNNLSGTGTGAER